MMMWWSLLACGPQCPDDLEPFTCEVAALGPEGNVVPDGQPLALVLGFQGGQHVDIELSVDNGDERMAMSTRVTDVSGAVYGEQVEVRVDTELDASETCDIPVRREMALVDQWYCDVVGAELQIEVTLERRDGEIATCRTSGPSVETTDLAGYCDESGG